MKIFLRPKIFSKKKKICLESSETSRKTILGWLPKSKEGACGAAWASGPKKVAWDHLKRRENHFLVGDQNQGGERGGMALWGGQVKIAGTGLP